MTAETLSIKKAFVPEEKEHGCYLEIDYRQLEIRVLALATQCHNLIDDLNSGADLHRVFASQIYKKPQSAVSDHERKLAKGFSFQLQYGAGANGIAKHWKVPKKLVQSFIDAYYTRYPEVKKWQDNNIKFVQDHAELIPGVMATNPDTGMEHTVMSSTVPSIWPGFENPKAGGFHIQQQWDKYKKDFVFPATQIKNYPIQGGAADIVLWVLTALHMNWPMLKTKFGTHVMLINTIHDSFIFELHDIDQAPHVASVLQDLIERSAGSIIKDMTQVKSPVAFPIDAQVGPNWADMRSIDLDS